MTYLTYLICTGILHACYQLQWYDPLLGGSFFSQLPCIGNTRKLATRCHKPSINGISPDIIGVNWDNPTTIDLLLQFQQCFTAMNEESSQ